MTARYEVRADHSSTLELSGSFPYAVVESATGYVKSRHVQRADAGMRADMLNMDEGRK